MIGRIKEYINEHGGLGKIVPALSQRAFSSDFARKVTETFLTRVLGMVIGIATSIIIARMLGPEGRGAYAMAAVVTATGIQFGNLGLPQASTYFVARDKSVLASTVGNSLFVSFVLGTIASIVAWAVFLLWPSVAPVHGILLAIAITCVPLGLAAMMLQNILLGLMDVRAFNISDMFGKVLGVALLVALIFYKKVSPETVYGTGLIVLVLTLAWLAWKIKKHVPGQVTISMSLLLEQIRYALKAYLSCFFAFMVMRVDLIMVNHYLGARETGVYSIAIATCNLLFTLPAVTSSILLPKLSAPNDFSVRWRTTVKTAYVVGSFMLVACVLSLIFGRFAIRTLYGEDFVGAYVPFCIILIGIFVWSVETIFRKLINTDPVKGFNINVVYTWGVTLVVNVVMNVILIPRMGMNGAAIATTCSMLLVGIIISLIVFHEYRQQTALERQHNLEGS